MAYIGGLEYLRIIHLDYIGNSWINNGLSGSKVIKGIERKDDILNSIKEMTDYFRNR